MSKDKDFIAQMEDKSLPEIDLCPSCRAKYGEYLKGTVMITDKYAEALEEANRNMEIVAREMKRRNDEDVAGEEWKDK